MGDRYLGRLDFDDPLFDILRSGIFSDVKDPRFHVTATSSRSVFKYTEEQTRVALIGKFCRLSDPCRDKVNRILGEFENLQKIRSFGFDTFPYYVVKPIDKSEHLGLALIEEFIRGKDLDYYLRKAIYQGEYSLLRDKLCILAYFLFVLHRKTETSVPVALDEVARYVLRIIDKLIRQGILSEHERKSYLRLVEKWLMGGYLDQDRSVIVHGDATPTNFLFTERGDVVAIDLERSKTSDPVFDVSMVCGELKHAFMWRTGNPYAAEPYIRHFLKSYTRHFSDSRKAFREITQRNPFYMALTELRIARNSYLDRQYRQRLAYEARQCLKWGLMLQ